MKWSSDNFSKLGTVYCRNLVCMWAVFSVWQDTCFPCSDFIVLPLFFQSSLICFFLLVLWITSLHYRFFSWILKQQWRTNQKREQRTCFSRSDVTFLCPPISFFFNSTQLYVCDPGNFRSLLSISVINSSHNLIIGFVIFNAFLEVPSLIFISLCDNLKLHSLKNKWRMGFISPNLIWVECRHLHLNQLPRLTS